MAKTFEELVIAQGGVRIPASAGAGLVAVSDASGNVAWQTLAQAGAVAAADRPYAVLTADMASITAQTTLQPITNLKLTIGASATEMWRVEWWLFVLAATGTGTATTEDLKLGIQAVPASCTAKGGPIVGNTVNLAGWGASVTTSSPVNAATQTTQVSVGTAAVTLAVPLVYTVYGGGTAGDVVLGYAQNTSDASTLQVLRGSHMRAHRLAT